MLEYFVVFSIFYFVYTVLRTTIMLTYDNEMKMLYEEGEIARTIEFLTIGMFMYYAYQHNLFNIQEWFFNIKQFYAIYGKPYDFDKLF